MIYRLIIQACTFLCLTMLVGCKDGSQSASGLFDFSDYRALKLRTVLELVVDKNGKYSDILIDEQKFPLSSMMLVDGAWEKIIAFRTSEGVDSTLTISTSEIGEEIELTAYVPKGFSNDDVVLLFDLDLSKQNGSLKLADVDTSKLSSLSVAKTNVSASTNPQIELSVATSMAVALTTSGSKSLISSADFSSFQELVSILHDVQKTLQDSVKRDESLDGGEYMKKLLARMGSSIKTDESIRSNLVTIIDRIAAGKGSDQVSTVATNVIEQDTSSSSSSIFVETTTNSSSSSTSATTTPTVADTTPPALTVTGQPTGTSTVSILDVTVGGTDVTDYTFKVGVSSSTDCSVSTGYSGSIAVANKITRSISSLADGAVKLCVKASDTAGNEAIVTSIWTKATVYAPTAPVTATKPTGTSYMFPRADDTGAGSTFLDGKLYFLVTTSGGAYMGRATTSGAMDTTFGTSGYVKLTDMTNTSSIATTGATVVACNNRLFGYASKKLYEYNFTAMTIISLYDMSTSEGTGADAGPMKCSKDQYIMVPIINNSNNTSAFLLYDTSTNQALADKVQSPSLGQYPYPILNSANSTWYLHYGDSVTALDSNFVATGSVYTIPSNIAGTNGWSFASADYNGDDINLLLKKNMVIRGVHMTITQFVNHFISGTSTWGALSSSYYQDYTVQNTYNGSSFLSELYGCYAGNKYFFMTYTTVGYTTGAFTFAFGLFGSSGISSGFNSGSELSLTTDPYNYYTARYYTSIACSGNRVAFLRPDASPYAATSITAMWLDGTQ